MTAFNQTRSSALNNMTGELLMLRTSLAALALAALCACSAKVNNLPGQCSTTADCAAGQVCDTSTGIGVCAAGCGDLVCGAGQTCVNNQCVATDCVPSCDPTYQECNKTANPPVCVATTCHPACEPNEICSPEDGGFNCIPLTTGEIIVTSPDAGTVSGIISPLAISATAGAPGGGPTKVELEVQQGGTTKASVEVDVGIDGVYASNVNLADAGLTTGAANVIGTVYWTLDGGELNSDSAPVAIEIDADPPTFGTATTDRSFYSGAASPAQTAHITVAVMDTGLAGVKPSSVILSAGGHSYPADSTAYPVGGNGNYLFAVPAGDLNTGDTFLGDVSYTVAASDNVGNVAAPLTGHSIALDNIPPGFSNITYDAGTWFGGDAGISIAVDVTDQTGGSGVDAGSVALVLSGGAEIGSQSPNGNTYTIATTGAAIQSSGQQGAVPFALTAFDNAGNVGIVDGGSILVDLAAPTIGATTVADNSATSVGGWYARDASSSKKVSVNTIVNDGSVGAGSGPKSATVTAGSSSPMTSSSGTVVDTGTSYTFLVPTSVQTAGSETPVALNISGADNVGNTVGPLAANDGAGNTVTLKIDDKGPAVSTVAITTTADGLGVDGTTSWFNQTLTTDVTVTATIVDNGSQVDPTSLQLVLQSDGTTRVDYGTVASLGNNSYQFKIKRSNGPVAAGAENLVAFKVIAKDKVGNAQQADDATHISLAQIGIDGKPPTVTIASSLYPANKAGCASDIDFCGHDGSHFLRKGETNPFGFTGADTSSGSGVDTSNGAAASTCSVAGSTGTCTSAYSTGNSQFQFTPDFSTATFASAADGTGTVSVTVTVKDRVGNVGTQTMANVAVTRVKWVRKASGGPINLAGSPIVTSTPVSQIIVGGGVNTGGTTIASFGLDGTKLWQAGSAQGITTISSNMAYSSTSNILYVVVEGGTTAYAFHVSASGVDKFATQTLSGSTGSPTIVSGSSEYMVVADSAAHKLYSLSCTPSAAGSGCLGESILNPVQWTTSLTTPTTDGTNIYLGHDGTGLSKVTIAANGNLTYGSDYVGSVTVQGSVAIGANLFFADTDNDVYQSITSGFGLVSPLWSGGGGPTGAFPVTSAVVSSQYVFGSFQKNATVDGHLYAYSIAGTTTSGATAFTYPATSSASIGALSPVALGADKTIYVSHATSPEMLALAAPTTGTVATKVWSFTGVTGIAMPSAATTEPSIDSSGTMYFGDSSGDVFALITDSGGPLAPSKASGTANWPRVGFDNCNSGNTSFSCQ